MTTYKIGFVNPYCTVVNEYWSGHLMKKIVVRAKYNGGDIIDFIDRNSHYVSWFNFEKQFSLF